MSKLFEPLTLRGVTLRNRLALSPMCQYTAKDGFANDYHTVHYGRFALGGFGLVMLEATAVLPEGRITHGDLGIWSDDHVEGLKRIADFAKSHGAVSGIQIGHAGPKASMQRAFQGNGPMDEGDAARGEYPWPVVSPTDRPVADGWLTPTPLDANGIQRVKDSFVSAAKRAVEAGFEVLELHYAHGFLVNAFMSPLTNDRNDSYGGSYENRTRLPLEIAREVREVWPSDKPLFVRLSAVDGSRQGWTIEDSVELGKQLKHLGVDVIDCSSGGFGIFEYPNGYGFQAPFSERIRHDAGMETMAVGLIVDWHQAEDLIVSGQADIVAIGREALRNPSFAHHAKRALGAVDPELPYSHWHVQAGWWLNGREARLRQLGPRQPDAQTAAA
ncbi:MULTISPECIES: NADH:flavin oxidoreductase/NADH oxidase [unclassified Stenotrophomonas]|uniref:NADH:flavin oxidoreductase/NADH oxidase n=1 Tax=unclassified Stenotrophomonas TaxID=196198 RepID=UPI003F9904C7